jgi:hypothetical protein
MNPLFNSLQYNGLAWAWNLIKFHPQERFIEGETEGRSPFGLASNHSGYGMRDRIIHDFNLLF